MIFKQLTESNGWILVEYAATWKYGYDFMLDAAQTVIDIDFQDKLQRVATAFIAGAEEVEYLEDVKRANNNLRECSKTNQECGALIIAGNSKIMECPVQFIFFNQTNVVRVYCPFKQYFEEHGEHVFDNYLNSIEIKAYCKDTERRTIERLRNR